MRLELTELAELLNFNLYRTYAIVTKPWLVRDTDCLIIA